MDQRSLDLTDGISDEHFQNLPLNHQHEVTDLMAKLILTVFQSTQEESYDDTKSN